MKIQTVVQSALFSFLIGTLSQEYGQSLSLNMNSLKMHHQNNSENRKRKRERKEKTQSDLILTVENIQHLDFIQE